MGTSNTIDARFTNPIFTNKFTNVVAKNYQRLDLAGIRLAAQAPDYVAGTIMSRNTVNGLYQPYNFSASSGLNVAACVLLDSVVNMDGVETPSARGIFHGELYNAVCLDFNGAVLDSGGKTNLGARTYTDIDGTVILTF